MDMAGYEYTKHNASGIKIYWRCCKYKNLKCFARATTEGNYVVKNVGEHNHWNKHFYDSWLKPFKRIDNFLVNGSYRNSNLFADPFEMAKFTASRKVQPQLVDTEGYEYTKHRNDRSGVKIYWRCSKYKSL